MSNRRYILYDGRAAGGDTSDATVLCFEDTLREARKSARGFGEAVIFSFIEVPDPLDPTGAYEIKDETFVEVVRS